MEDWVRSVASCFTRAYREAPSVFWLQRGPSKLPVVKPRGSFVRHGDRTMPAGRASSSSACSFLRGGRTRTLRGTGTMLVAEPTHGSFAQTVISLDDQMA